MFAILGQTVCWIFLCVCVFLSNKALSRPVTSVLSCSTETFLCTIKYIYYNFPWLVKYEIKQYILGSGVWFHKRTHLPTMHKALDSLLSTTKKKKKETSIISCQTVSLLVGALHSLSTLLELFLNGIKVHQPILALSNEKLSSFRNMLLYVVAADGFQMKGSKGLCLTVWSLSSCNCLDPDQKICKESFSLTHRKSVLKMICAPCQCLSRCEWDQLLKQIQVPSL